MNINRCATFSLPPNNDEIPSGLNPLTGLALDGHKAGNLAGLNRDIVASITDWQHHKDFVKLSNSSFVYQTRMSRIDYALAINFITGKSFDAKTLTDTHVALNRINQLLPHYRPLALNALISTFEKKYESTRWRYEGTRHVMCKKLIPYKEQFDIIQQQIPRLLPEDQPPLLSKLSKWFDWEGTGLGFQEFEQLYSASRKLTTHQQEAFISDLNGLEDRNYAPKLLHILKDHQKRPSKDRVDPEILAKMFRGYQLNSENQFGTTLEIIKNYPEEERNPLLASLLNCARIDPGPSYINSIIQTATASTIGKEALLEQILINVKWYPDKYAEKLEAISKKFLSTASGKEADPKIFYRIARSIEDAPIDQRLAPLRELLSAYKYLPEKEHSAALHAIGNALAQLPDSALVSEVKEEWQTCSNNSSWAFA